jgi:hypothetical protein
VGKKAWSSPEGRVFLLIRGIAFVARPSSFWLTLCSTEANLPMAFRGSVQLVTNVS